MTFKKGDPRLTASKKRHYQKHRQAYLDTSKERWRRRQDFIDALKKNPCADCEQSFPPYVMDFDHLPDVQKVAGLSQMKGASIEAIIAEIAKCELVCSNCHRIRTYNRRIAKKEAA